jgi:hypothetical protein
MCCTYVFFFTDNGVNISYYVASDQFMLNCEAYGKKQSWPNWRYNPNIWLGRNVQNNRLNRRIAHLT